MTAGAFPVSVPRLSWPAKQHHDIVIATRQIPDATDRFVFFFGLQPYELDELGGGIDCVDFDRHRGSFPVRPFHRRRGSSRRPANTSDLIPP